MEFPLNVFERSVYNYVKQITKTRFTHRFVIKNKASIMKQVVRVSLNWAKGIGIKRMEEKLDRPRESITSTQSGDAEPKSGAEGGD